MSDEALTEREVEVLRQIAGGNRNRDIAEQLFISEETVKVHIKHIMEKLGASDRTQAVAIGSGAESSNCERAAGTTIVVLKNSEPWGFALPLQSLLLGCVRNSTNEYLGDTSCNGCFPRFRAGGPAQACCCCEQRSVLR